MLAVGEAEKATVQSEALAQYWKSERRADSLDFFAYLFSILISLIAVANFVYAVILLVTIDHSNNSYYYDEGVVDRYQIIIGLASIVAGILWLLIALYVFSRISWFANSLRNTGHALRIAATQMQ